MFSNETGFVKTRCCDYSYKHIHKLFTLLWIFVLLKISSVPSLHHRPLIPVSKLTVSEPYENYMSRSYQVTKDILTDCKNTGERRYTRHLEAVLARSPCGGEPRCSSGQRCFLPDELLPTPSSLFAGHNVLIVAHASSLEACTRQLQGRSPQSPKDFIQVVRKVCLWLSCSLFLWFLCWEASCCWLFPWSVQVLLLSFIHFLLRPISLWMWKRTKGQWAMNEADYFTTTTSS